MPFLRKPPRGRRRANLQIDYPFDRVAYVRWRLRCWGGARLRQGGAALRRAAAPVRRVAGAAGSVRRWARKGTVAAVPPPEGAGSWLRPRLGLLAAEVPAE